MLDILFFIVAMGLSGLATWQFLTWRNEKKFIGEKGQVATESHVLLERIEKVFKVVLAEGYFTEIYDHNTRKNFFGLFKTNSKALVVAKAKVAVGFDFSKMHFRRDAVTRTLIVEQFAEPEIIAIDTDYTFYDINQGLLNKFDNEDYTAILAEAKKLMQEKAFESDLPQIALNQIQLMMQQLCASAGWKLEQDNMLQPVKTLEIEKINRQ